MIILPARQSRVKVKYIATSAASVGKAFIGPALNEPSYDFFYIIRRATNRLLLDAENLFIARRMK